MPTSNFKKQEVQLNNAELFPKLIALLEAGHTVTLTLTGFSMRPFLEDRRDIAELRHAKNPKVGEPVLAIVGDNHYVLHRLIKIEGDNVTLLGDGNLSTEHCKLSDIKAQVVGFYRKGRKTPDTIDGWKWKCYSIIWMALRPVRRYILYIYRQWVKIFGTV